MTVFPRVRLPSVVRPVRHLSPVRHSSSSGTRRWSRLHLGLLLLLSSSATTGRRSAPTLLARSLTVAPTFWSTRGFTSRSSLLVSTNYRGGGSAAALPFSTSPSTRPVTSTTRLASMPSTTISLTPDADQVSTLMVIGTKTVLQQVLTNPTVLSSLNATRLPVSVMLDSIEGPSGTAATYNDQDQKVVLATIPEPTSLSRHNHPWSPHTITDLVAKSLPPNGRSRVIFCGPDVLEYPGALVAAVAKAFPVYSRKTTSKDDDPVRSLQILWWNDQGQLVEPTPDVSRTALAAVTGLQLAAKLVDMPPAELTTDQYAAECRAWAHQWEEVTFREIVGDELDQQGYGGLYGVGKAATCPPRLVIMEYTPATVASDETIALVGKGIVYDTGGLSLKPKVGMCGMKSDMGGSAGLLGGFVAAVQAGYAATKLTLVLCLAENAIGPTAFRNDDILTMYSGKTVEVNNADAEGRLVLGDGVAHVTKHIPDLSLVVDMATLTGAQLVATGKKHAGILANTEELEKQAVAAGLQSGDLAYPLLYAPELLKSEFASKVADMKNSVKDRSNAQTSCAGHFIESHLHEDYKGGWMHVDMAGPATKDERGTGYGVGFILSLLKMPGF